MGSLQFLPEQLQGPAEVAAQEEICPYKPFGNRLHVRADRRAKPLHDPLMGSRLPTDQFVRSPEKIVAPSKMFLILSTFEVFQEEMS